MLVVRSWKRGVSALVLLAPLVSGAQTPARAAQGQPPPAPVALPGSALTGLAFRPLALTASAPGLSVSGSKQRPRELLAGTTGGVFKSTDWGRTWSPISDGQLRSSAAGAIAVAPSHPDTIYVGMGDPRVDATSQPGDGVYRSVDGGKTWTNQGLTETLVIAQLRVHPTNAAIAYAAAFGHPWGRHKDRGIYRTTDAGRTWTQVLFRGDSVGAIDVSLDTKDPRVVLAAFWHRAPRPWGLSSGSASGLYRSVDGGDSWKDITRAPGLPAGAGRMGVSISPVDGSRVYAIVEHAAGGVFVSNDSGATWTRANGEAARQVGIVQTARVEADPSVKDRVYLVAGGLWRSDDAGKTFSRLAALGDAVPMDVWIAPGAPSRIAAATSAGVVVSEDGGRTFIGAADRRVVVSPEQALVRLDVQSTTIGPAPRLPRVSGRSERWSATPPVAASADGRTLFTASQAVWRSTNSGASWKRLSPDLTRGVDSATSDRHRARPTVSTIAPSRVEPGVLWAGSDDGVVSLSRDGGATWKTVTPAALPRTARIARISASPHEAGKALVAIQRSTSDDRAPYIWKTPDYGATWTVVADGLRSDATVHAVHEDPARKGLLFAGTEHGAFVSFDDGTRWQPLGGGLPDLQVADLLVGEDGLVVSTRGRSLWILDHVAPLRQLTLDAIKAPILVIKPRDLPRTANEAAFFYHLAREADSIVVEIVDAGGSVVRRAATDKSVADSTAARAGAPTRRLGLNRYTWDLRSSSGTAAAAGEYQVRVTAGKESRAERFRVVQPGTR